MRVEEESMKISLVLLCLTSLLLITHSVVAQQAQPKASIHELFEQDQRDQQIDFDALSPAEQKKLNERYAERERLLKELMQDGGIHQPQDFFDAGVVLTHSHAPENQLLAHLTFTAAAFEGVVEAKHLAATSLDRYLTLPHQNSIFGTTFQIPYRGWQHTVSPDMDDSLRAAFCVPPLKRLDEMFEQGKRGIPPPNTGRDQYWDVTPKGCQ
jgi:hypothetical protein